MPIAPLSDSEWTVMDAVWRLGGPVTARRVLNEVEGTSGWAYTTVKTMLDRLVEKGVLGVAEGEGAGRSAGALRYRPLLTRSRARRQAVAALVEKAFGGAVGPLVHELVQDERLSEGDREELRRMLDESPDEDRDEDRDG